MNIKKVKLNIEPDDDFILVGIVSQDPLYKLVWMLNNELGYLFKKVEDLIVPCAGSKEVVNFQRYLFDDELAYSQYTLVANKFDSKILLGEYKQIDYILKIDGITSLDSINRCIEKYRSISSVIAVMRLEAGAKIKERFIS